jgi:hypothetical protein
MRKCQYTLAPSFHRTTKTCKCLSREVQIQRSNVMSRSYNWRTVHDKRRPYRITLAAHLGHQPGQQCTHRITRSLHPSPSNRKRSVAHIPSASSRPVLASTHAVIGLLVTRSAPRQQSLNQRYSHVQHISFLFAQYLDLLIL